ncbi:MAG: tetratricopeptide repeat protein [Pseudomonadales bacterium]|nr:tetratricopeptide repeat protein [Pseudomonadales bacterium]
MCFRSLPLAAAAEDEVPAALLPLDALVDDSRFDEAYALAQTMLAEWEGEPLFDYLYGSAALESGHANAAIFAFERLVQDYPGEPSLKLDLARAQFAQRNLAAARELFEEVRATQPEPNVQRNIRAFLDAIADREDATHSRLIWFVSALFGHDSNINSATQLDTIGTPLGEVTLQPNTQAIADSFADLTGGVAYFKPLNKLAAFNFNASYQRHDKLTSNDFDLDVFAANASYTRTYGNLRLSGGGRVQKANLASNPFQNSASLLVSAERSANGEGWTPLLTLAYTGVRYGTTAVANANLRDVNQWLLSGVLGKHQGRFNHNVSLFYGTETARYAQGNDNAQTFYGLAWIEQFQWRPSHTPYLRVSLQHSQNQAPTPLFGITRKADLVATALGWLWRSSDQLDLTAELNYLNNDANLDLFAYERLKVQAGLRYQF